MIGIFDNIVAPYFPVDHPAMSLCMQLEFEATEASGPLDVNVRFLDDDARSLIDLNASGEVPRDLNGGPVRMFMHFQIPGLKIEHAGNYRLDVRVRPQWSLRRRRGG